MHALRVLRVTAGDELHGLDGQGGRFPLRVREARRDLLALESTGPTEREPAPGEEGARLPWFELVVSWPRRTRAEDMLGRLVQLGAASIRPLRARWRGPEDVPASASERLRRVAREACKQSGRSWLPELGAPLSPAELVAERRSSAIALLDPNAGLALDSWMRSLRPGPASLGTRARPIVLVVGPEGGLTPEEREVLLVAGASPTWLAPWVLRIETAAEAAMAVAAVVHGRAPR